MKYIDYLFVEFHEFEKTIENIYPTDSLIANGLMRSSVATTIDCLFSRKARDMEFLNQVVESPDDEYPKRIYYGLKEAGVKTDIRDPTYVKRDRDFAHYSKISLPYDENAKGTILPSIIDDNFYRRAKSPREILPFFDRSDTSKWFGNFIYEHTYLFVGEMSNPPIYSVTKD